MSCPKVKTTLSAGALALATTMGATPSASAALFGNDVFLGNSATGAINTTAIREAQKFIATSNLTVDRVHYQFNSLVGAAQLQWAIQADNGAGLPNGVDLAVASAVGSAGQTGYTTSLNTPLALTAGSTYHVVARATSADASNSATVRVLTTSTINTNAPAGAQGAVTARTRSTNSGSSYSAPATNQTTIWGLSNSSTGQSIAQPYSTTQITNFGGATWAGQRFTYTGGTGKLDKLSIHLRGSAINPTLGDDLRVHIVPVVTQEPGTPTGGMTAVTSVVPGASLYDGVLLTSGTALAAAPGALYQHDLAALAEPTLVQGQSYMLLFETSVADRAVLSYNQGNDNASQTFGGANLNFQNMNDGFAVVSSEATDGVTGLPSRFFTLDTAGPASYIFRDTRFILDVTPIPEPAALATLLAGAGALMIRRRAHQRQ